VCYKFTCSVYSKSHSECNCWCVYSQVYSMGANSYARNCADLSSGFNFINSERKYKNLLKNNACFCMFLKGKIPTSEMCLMQLSRTVLIFYNISYGSWKSPFSCREFIIKNMLINMINWFI
jgi:hypothetical protein